MPLLFCPFCIYFVLEKLICMKTMRLFAFLLMVATAFEACDKPNNELKPLELSTKAASFVKEGAPFTFEYIERINAEAEKDYIISPLSMQFLLGMILNGARGETLDEICDVLGYGAGETEAVNEYCLSLLRQLPSMDKKTKLEIANAIFVDDGWPLLDSYKSIVGKNYDAKIDNLNFGEIEKSTKIINNWCKDHTNGMIPKILDQVDPAMLCYLLNAMYFKSEWKDKFSKSLTAYEEFTNERGVMSTVKMMKQERRYYYYECDCFQAVRLPYGNGAFSMTVLLPKKGFKVADVAKALRETDWDDLRRSFSSTEVDLWLPRFETKYSIKLNDILSAMGMPSSFDSAKADFKAMSNYAGYLSFVKQDAAIKVDEEGTEAAVVSSAGMMKESAMPADNVVFHADHPFLYLITEQATGVVLFAGRYANIL